MSGADWTPDEFARLMALSPDHPERVAAEADPAFVAWARMAGVFESGDGAPLDEAALAPRRAELARRLERELRPVADVAPRRAGWFERFVAGWATPPGRAAFAFAALVCVASAGWWLMANRDAGEPMRGAPTEVREVRWLEPARADGKLRLRWDAVPGAERYELVFHSAELVELARVDAGASTDREFAAGSLPAGLAAGARIEVEVVAIARGDELARSRLVELQLP